jgi:hypothetical protein
MANKNLVFSAQNLKNKIMDELSVVDIYENTEKEDKADLLASDKRAEIEALLLADEEEEDDEDIE